MADYSAHNKLILKNSLALCGRLFITMGISFYAARLLLAHIGVTDYGVYQIVGGVVTFFGFLNAVMLTATQRFLNYEMGESGPRNLSEVFSTSLHIHALVALFLLLVTETLGLYLVNFTLDIPPDRLSSANWVYQISILSALINILTVPYNALIIAYEKMTVFAVVTIVQSVVNLGICLLLGCMETDRLILYAFLLCALHVGIRLYYGFYCSRKFPSVSYHFRLGRSRMREMLSFAGWTTGGAFAYMTYTQGVSMVLNVFFGPVVNAAQSVSNQISLSLSTFSANIMTATKPQITQSYAQGGIPRMQSLVFMSSKFCFLVMLMLSLPFLVRTAYVLEFWLTEVPAHTEAFLKLTLLMSVWQALASPAATAIDATGKVRSFRIFVSLVLLLILPVTILALHRGAPPESAYWITFSFLLVAQGVRAYFMKRQLNFSIGAYSIQVARLLLTSALTYALLSWASEYLPLNFVGFLLLCLLSLVSVSIVGALVGLEAHERAFLLGAVKRVIGRKA